jgi:hypothetical protein
MPFKNLLELILLEKIQVPNEKQTDPFLFQELRAIISRKAELSTEIALILDAKKQEILKQHKGELWSSTLLKQQQEDKKYWLEKKYFTVKEHLEMQRLKLKKQLLDENRRITPDKSTTENQQIKARVKIIQGEIEKIEHQKLELLQAYRRKIYPLRLRYGEKIFNGLPLTNEELSPLTEAERISNKNCIAYEAEYSAFEHSLNKDYQEQVVCKLSMSITQRYHDLISQYEAALCPHNIYALKALIESIELEDQQASKDFIPLHEPEESKMVVGIIIAMIAVPVILIPMLASLQSLLLLVLIEVALALCILSYFSKDRKSSSNAQESEKKLGGFTRMNYWRTNPMSKSEQGIPEHQSTKLDDAATGP